MSLLGCTGGTYYFGDFLSSDQAELAHHFAGILARGLACNREAGIMQKSCLMVAMKLAGVRNGWLAAAACLCLVSRPDPD